jgi:beta-glucosidase
MLTDWRAAYDTVPTALAGTDMTTGFCAYVFADGRLLEAMKSGRISQALLDDKVRRVLRLYIRTGVLDPGGRAKGELDSPRHRALARSLATEGMVLLKNDRGALPLDTAKLRRVLVAGPTAATVPFGGGSGAVRPPFEVTPWQGIQKALGGKAEVVHIPQEGAALPQAAQGADVVLFFARDERHGEGGDRKSMDLPGGQAEALTALAAAHANVVVVLLAGGPVIVEPWVDRVPAILCAWYAG